MRGGPEWYLVEPPGWLAVPAALAAEVIDRRVVLAEPPGAFRYDMRAVSPWYVEDGREYVDVVSEHDWYRSRIRAEPVPSSRYPAERVWVEQRAAGGTDAAGGLGDPSIEAAADDAAGRPGRPAPAAAPATPGPTRAPAGRAPGGLGNGTAGTVFDRLGSPDAPQGRRPRRAGEVADLTGRRIVVLQPDGPVYHRRAVSEPYVGPDGQDVALTICSEYDWYRWAITREPPRAERFPIYLAWVE